MVVVIAFLLLGAVAVVTAEEGQAAEEAETMKEPTAFDRNAHALGVFAGGIGGVGLHYQHWFGKLGVQTAFGIFYSPEGDSFDPFFFFGGAASYDEYQWRDPDSEALYYSYYRTRLSYNIGLEFLYRLFAEDFAKWFSGNLYIFGGINHSGIDQFYYDKKKVEYTDGESGYYWTEDYTKKIEVGYSPNLSMGLGIGVEPMLFQHFSLPLEFGFGLFWEGMEFDKNAFFINPIIQAGLRYRFQ